MDDKLEQTLREIFSEADHIQDIEPNLSVISASFDDVVALAYLLPDANKEEVLQQEIAKRPQLLIGSLGYAQSKDLAFLTKPLIGTQFKADFALLSSDQGGCDVHLIELETADVQLFTQNNTPAKRLQSALGQIADWDEWIQRNTATYIRDLIDHCKKLPQCPEKSENGSFRLVDAKRLENTWRGFGGFDHPTFWYTVVIGRWSQLSDKHRKRLIYLNKKNGVHQQIRTYEQIARRSYSRPAIHHY